MAIINLPAGRGRSVSVSDEKRKPLCKTFVTAVVQWSFGLDGAGKVAASLQVS
jgi:hypothetical protein